MDVIRIQNFSKRFGSKVVHKNISFVVREGECLGLLGGSGAGKSVILRSLIGLEKPDQGEIFIDSEEITNKSEDELVDIRKKVAYVFQNGALFDSMSVFDNLAYPLREHTNHTEEEIKLIIKETLLEFGLEGNENIYPAELSGGMQKRVGLARSIIINPHVVLYDEPTAGLDPYNTLKIQEMILKMKKRGVTSVFVTHDMPSAFAVCDRIALVKDGIISDIKSIAEINNQSESQINQFIKGHLY